MPLEPEGAGRAGTRAHWALPSGTTFGGSGLSTIRTRLLPRSATKRSPPAFRTTPAGLLRRASTAGPPSPEKPAAPLPTMVLMTPAPLTRRTRLLFWSAM